MRYYHHSNGKTKQGLEWWKDLRDVNAKLIYGEFNNSKEIIFKV